MAWDGLNRRQFPRIEYPCLVKLASKTGQTEALLAHTENISVGGIGIIVKKEIPMFTVVDIEIDLLEEAEHIVCRGKVVWVVRRKAVETTKPMFYDIGIEFENLAEKDRKRLMDVTALLIKKGYKVLKPVY